VKLAVGIVDAHQIPLFDSEHSRQPFWNDDLEKIPLDLGDAAGTLHKLIAPRGERDYQDQFPVDF
jgi:hypothetical protein